MRCRSEERILCPWCGAEMKRDWRQTEYGKPSRKVWFACENCKSNSPIAWGENYDEALKTATEYALRRYTPPITTEKKLVCPINGAPCSECKPGSPCGVEVKDE